jgi:hypothetical protein
MINRFVQITAVLTIMVASTAAQAAGTDPLTGLPLYPGMESAGPAVAEDVCGTQVKNSTYTPREGNLAAIDGWYAHHLTSFNVNHGQNRNYPYDIFVSADGTTSITILGSGPKTGVQGVVYHKNAKPASMVNIANWLTGANALCK